LSDEFGAPCETLKLCESDVACTAQCKMLLFCAKTIMKESHNFELKEEEKEEN